MIDATTDSAHLPGRVICRNEKAQLDDWARMYLKGGLATVMPIEVREAYRGDEYREKPAHEHSDEFCREHEFRVHIEHIASTM